MVSRKMKKPASEDKKKAKVGAGPEAPEPEAPAPEAPAPEKEAKAGEVPAEAPAPDRTAELEAQVADLTDKFQRSVAELENYRRRAEKEREDVAKYAISNFVRDILTVADNLGLALASISAEVRGEDQHIDKLAAGVELTERELMAAFERHGITKVDPMGESFNHDLHQAMFEIEDAGKPAGTIVEVMQAGYVLKDRLLRPAMVGVTKGGAARTEAPGAAEGDAATPAAGSEAGADQGQAPSSAPGPVKEPAGDGAKQPPEGPEHVDTKA